MPTVSPTLLPILMLFASNVFMTFAWYGHLKFKESPLPLVVLASWGIAFFEYWLAVPANRWGSAVYSAAQLKTMQEVITLVVFAGFSVLYLKEPLGWNHALGFALHRRRRVFDFPQMGVTCASVDDGNGRLVHFAAGATRKMRPVELSVSSHSAPSGPWRTSRMRSCRFCSRRSSAVTALPFSVSRTSIAPRSAPVNRLPFHFGNSFPV